MDPAAGQLDTSVKSDKKEPCRELQCAKRVASLVVVFQRAIYISYVFCAHACPIDTSSFRIDCLMVCYGSRHTAARASARTHVENPSHTVVFFGSFQDILGKSHASWSLSLRFLLNEKPHSGLVLFCSTYISPTSCFPSHTCSTQSPIGAVCVHKGLALQDI